MSVFKLGAQRCISNSSCLNQISNRNLAHSMTTALLDGRKDQVGLVDNAILRCSGFIDIETSPKRMAGLLVAWWPGGLDA